MPLGSRKVAYQAKPEKPTPKSSKETPKETRSPSGDGRCSQEEAPDKMGSMISIITKGVTPKTLAAHGSSEPDEIPSRPASASSREHAASPDAPLQSGLLWPYVSHHAHDGDSDSEHPLRFRRPALYEEYWRDESD